MLDRTERLLYGARRRSHAPRSGERRMKQVALLLLVSSFGFGATPAAAQKVGGGLLLDSRGGPVKGGDSDPVVVAGQPEKSLLIQAVRYRNEQLQMPPPGKLPERDIATLGEWVRRGSPFPGPGTAAGS